MVGLINSLENKIIKMGTQCRVVITKQENQELENMVDKMKEGNQTLKSQNQMWLMIFSEI
jgi:hypothetical protein